HLGIVGAGQISNLHVPPYLKDKRVNVYAVCDREPDLALEKSLKWGCERTYARFEEMLADPRIDAVEILTPHHLHAEMALAAARAGKHIHLAKPIALSLSDADAIIRAVRDHRVVLKISEPALFYAPIVEAKALLDS